MSRAAIGFMTFVLVSGAILGQQITPTTIPNCKTVVFSQLLNKSVCGECNNGFYVETSGQVCSPCLSSCVRCSVTASTCQECKNGFYLSINTCNACSVGCQSCSTTQVCSACNTGYFMVATSTQGSACSNCMSGCMSCSSKTDCASCFSSYTRTIENGVVSCKMNGLGVFLIIILLLILLCVCACIAWAVCIYCCAKTIIVEDRSSFAEVQPTTVVVEETYY